MKVSSSRPHSKEDSDPFWVAVADALGVIAEETASVA